MKAKAKKKPNKKQEVQPVEESIFYAIDVSNGFEGDNLVGEVPVLGPAYSEEEINSEIRSYCEPVVDDIFHYQFIIVKQENTVSVEMTRSVKINYGIALDISPREELPGYSEWTEDEKQDQ